MYKALIIKDHRQVLIYRYTVKWLNNKLGLYLKHGKTNTVCLQTANPHYN